MRIFDHKICALSRTNAGCMKREPKTLAAKCCCEECTKAGCPDRCLNASDKCGQCRQGNRK